LRTITFLWVEGMGAVAGRRLSGFGQPTVTYPTTEDR